MARDYANKPKARKGAVRRSPVSKGQKKKAGKGKLVSVLALLVLIVALGFGLYRLALVQPNPEVTQEQVQHQQAEQAATSKPKVETPKVEESEAGYSFYKILPKSEVVPPVVPEYKSTPKSAKTYSHHILQAGSFRNLADADRLRAELILKGLPNVVIKKGESSSGNIWYRVRTGPFDSRSQLNKAQDKLVRMNLQPMQIKLSK